MLAFLQVQIKAECVKKQWATKSILKKLPLKMTIRNWLMLKVIMIIWVVV